MSSSVCKCSILVWWIVVEQILFMFSKLHTRLLLKGFCSCSPEVQDQMFHCGLELGDSTSLYGTLRDLHLPVSH